MSSTTQQVMMTLAALAATGATERPSGESLEQQEQRILTGINSQLANISLATAGQWSAIWVGLTASRANLAYIAKNNTGVSPQYALCLRGTVAARRSTPPKTWRWALCCLSRRAAVATSPRAPWRLLPTSSRALS